MYTHDFFSLYVSYRARLLKKYTLNHLLVQINHLKVFEVSICLWIRSMPYLIECLLFDARAHTRECACVRMFAFSLNSTIQLFDCCCCCTTINGGAYYLSRLIIYLYEIECCVDFSKRGFYVADTRARFRIYTFVYLYFTCNISPKWFYLASVASATAKTSNVFILSAKHYRQTDHQRWQIRIFTLCVFASIIMWVRDTFFGVVSIFKKIQ